MWGNFTKVGFLFSIVKVQSSTDYKPHGAADFFKTISFDFVFLNKFHYSFIKSHQFHAASNRWKTVS